MVALYVTPASKKESGRFIFRGFQFVIAPTNQSLPFFRAVTMYSPNLASAITVSSQVVGMLPSKSINCGSNKPCDGLPEKNCMGLSYTTNIASWCVRVPCDITLFQMGRNVSFVPLSNKPGS